jgi:hypothetical protein
MFVLGVWQCSVTASSFRSRDALVSDEAKLVGEYVIANPLMDRYSYRLTVNVYFGWFSFRKSDNVLGLSSYR